MEPNREKEGRGGDERHQTEGDQSAAGIPAEEMVDGMGGNRDTIKNQRARSAQGLGEHPIFFLSMKHDATDQHSRTHDKSNGHPRGRRNQIVLE